MKLFSEREEEETGKRERPSSAFSFPNVQFACGRKSMLDLSCSQSGGYGGRESAVAFRRSSVGLCVGIILSFRVSSSGRSNALGSLDS